MTPLLAIGPEPLDIDRLVAAIGAGGAAGVDGAVVTFLGLVRNHNLGRIVRYLEYEAYEPLALKAFERIAGETRERWPGVTAGPAPSDRAAGDRRGKRRDRGGVPAPRGRVFAPAATRSSA